MNKFLNVSVSLLIPISIGVVVGLITSHDVVSPWFINLKKPVFFPPNTIFAPVWTVLYILMGVSSYLVWIKPPSKERTNALVIYGIQLFFNFWWSLLFFHYHQVGLSLVDIAILWLCIVVMIFNFKRVSAKACYLQIPYLVWVSFAFMLNTSIWILNS